MSSTMNDEQAERMAQLEQATPAYALVNVRRAWKIATYWHKRFKRDVTLVTSESTPMQVRPSFEWVAIEIHPSPFRRTTPTAGNEVIIERNERMGTLVRALCIVWTMLSRCKGYGGHENPVFWRHVFDFMGTDSYGVTDSQSFFQHHVFPRFQLKVHRFNERRALESFCRGFFGSNPSPNDIAMNTTSRFAEFFRRFNSNLPSCCIDVCFNFGDKFDLLTSFQAPVGRGITSPGVNFVTHEVQFGPVISLNSVETYILNQEVDIPCLHLDLNRYRSWETLADVQNLHALLRAAFKIEGKRNQSHVHGIQISGKEGSMSNHVIGAVCSSLPVARSVRRLNYESRRGICVPDRVWAWIGYALFHPDSAISTFQELHLSRIQTADNVTRALLSMAKGNNLLALLSGTPAQSTSFFRATLSPYSSIIHSTTVTAPLWTTPAEVSSFDVCVNSTDIGSLEEWVPIVVPGVGLAYTNRRNVIAIATRPTSKVSLRALHLHLLSESDPTCRSLPQFLELFGPSLEHLSVRIDKPSEHSDLLKPAVMCPLLSRFPSLVSLSIHDNGEFWNDDVRRLPQLKELELRIDHDREFVPFSNTATRTSLRRLASLSLHRTSSIPFEPSSIRLILDGIPSLQHLHCESGKPLSRRIKSYTSCRRMSMVRLGFSPILLSQRGRYALLSVVHHKALTLSAIGKLDPVLLKIVVEFAGDSIGPDVCIQDWREDSTCPIVANDIMMS